MSQGGNPGDPTNPYRRGYTQPLAVPPTVDQYPVAPKPDAGAATPAPALPGQAPLPDPLPPQAGFGQPPFAATLQPQPTAGYAPPAAGRAPYAASPPAAAFAPQASRQGPYAGSAPNTPQSGAVPLGAPPGKSSRLLVLVLGLSGALLLILLAAGGYAAYRAKQHFDGLAAQLEQAKRAVELQPLTGGCQLAYDCCLNLTRSASNAALGAQCENFKSPGHSEMECREALSGYAKVAASRGLTCE